jgi:hypothetical protein
MDLPLQWTKGKEGKRRELLSGSLEEGDSQC